MNKQIGIIYKLIKLEAVKFRKNKKNRLLILVAILYILGLVFNNHIQFRDFFFQMEKNMRDERFRASGVFNTLELLRKNDKNYIEDPLEVEYLTKEIKKSIMLGHYYKENTEDWKRILQIENEKYENLLFGQEHGFINNKVLASRGQDPFVLRSKIIQNNHLLERNVAVSINPYKLNGLAFLTLILSGYTPMILVVLSALLSMDIFLGEVEEGSYKLYYTQPFSKSHIYWSKILSILLFAISIFMGIIITGFIIVSLIYGMGDLQYPKVIVDYDSLKSLWMNMNRVGEFQIVPVLTYILLGYLLLFGVIIMLTLLIVTLSLVLKSIATTIGAFSSILIAYYVMDLFFNSESVFRFYLPLSYMKIEQVLIGQINASYFFGIVISIISSILMLIYSRNIITKKELLGGA